MRPRVPAILFALLLLVLLAAGARLVVGGLGDSHDQTVAFLRLRALRVVSGALVGAALAVAGVMLQALLRNPLASPDLLGLASGAGLGVMISIYLGQLAGLGIAHLGASAGAALAGALVVLLIVYLLSQRRGWLDPVSLVLVGVVVSMVCAAATDLVQHLMPDQGYAAARMLLGAIREDVPDRHIWAVGIVLLTAIVVGVVLGRAMDAASLAEDEARSVGVSLESLRAILFICSGVLAAGSVLLAGPVGFVGLVCPHIVRGCLGPAHRPLILGSALCGATLIILADTLIKAIRLDAGNLPLSVLTSFVGAPVLIALLRRRERGRL